jgi:hypothetical protein
VAAKPGSTRVRTVSQTPLARAHEHRLSAAGRLGRRGIRWSPFRREKYPAAALALGADALVELATGEYEAFVGFSQVSSALALVGAPFDIVAAAAEVPSDEIRHAEYALRLAGLMRGCQPGEIAIGVAHDKLQRLSARRWTLEAVDGMMAAVPAIHETLSAAFIAARRDGATDPVVRDVLSSILADEVHHARLGWYYLMWRAPSWTRTERQRVADRAGAIVMSLEKAFWRGRQFPRGCGTAARALGVLDEKTQRSIVRQVMEREILPALDGLGLGASHAWRARPRRPAE